MADLSSIPTDRLVQMLAAHPALNDAPAKPPTVAQDVAASPVGRFAHDFLLPMVEGPAKLLAKIDPTGGSVPRIADKGQQAYQAALAAQRTLPGYAAARAAADSAASARGAGGLTDQFIAPLAPAMAGVAGLFGGGRNGMNAAADAQAAAQTDYSKAHPVASTVAQIAGGALTAPEGIAAAIPAKTAQAIPTLDALNAAKTAAYKTVDASPMKIAQPAVKDLYDTVQGKLNRIGLTDSTMSALAPKTATAMSALKDAAQSEQTLQGMDIQRRIAGIAAGAPDKTDRMAARLMQDHIDDFVGNLQPSQLSGPADQTAIDALPVARDLASRSARAGQIQAVIDKAGVNGSNFSASGYENALRSGFRKLANNDRAIARFSPSEQDAIRAVATGGSALSATNLLRQVGKLSPQGAIPMLAEMGAVAAGGPHMLAVPAAGFAARLGATALTKSAAQKAFELAALGKSAAAPLSVPALQLPSITAQSAVPYGLFGSTFAQQQNQ